MRNIAGMIVVVTLGAGVALVSGACKSNSINQTNNNGSTIGPSGGIVVGPDNAEIRIPAGALATDVTFDIAVAQPSEYPPLGSFHVDGKVYAFLPHGQKFNTPVVVSLPHSGGGTVSGLHANAGGAWESVMATVTSDSVEITTTSLSFYAVGTSSDAGVAEGGPSCSGRGPVGGAPTGTVSFSMGGTIPATYWASGNGMPVDTSTITDGYAGPPPFNMNQFTISLTNYTQACGLAKNNDIKIGGSTLNITMMSKPTGPVIIPPSMLTVSGSQLPSTQPAGPCGANGSSGGPSSMGTGVTINTIDANRVTGSFDVFAGTMELKGNFDVPICPYDTTVTPACCLP